MYVLLPKGNKVQQTLHYNQKTNVTHVHIHATANGYIRMDDTSRCVPMGIGCVQSLERIQIYDFHCLQIWSTLVWCTMI